MRNETHFLRACPLTSCGVGLFACIRNCLVGSHEMYDGFLRSPPYICSCFPLVSHSYRFYPSRRKSVVSCQLSVVSCRLRCYGLSGIKSLTLRCLMFEIRCAFSNVYAAWTMSTSLFRLEVGRKLSSFIGGFGRVVLSRFLLLSAQKLRQNIC